MHLSTGFVSTPWLLTGLNDIGYPGTAYKIATQTTFPSWYDMVFNSDHNVFNEHWDGGAVQMPSLAGGLGSWLFSSLAGIKPDLKAPGFRNFIIDPAYSTPLRYVKASYRTIYGTIEISWKKEKDKILMDLKVPENTKSRVFLPSDDITNVLDNDRPVTGYIEIRYGKDDNGRSYLLLGSGRYQLSIPSQEPNNRLTM